MQVFRKDFNEDDLKDVTIVLSKVLEIIYSSEDIGEKTIDIFREVNRTDISAPADSFP